MWVIKYKTGARNEKGEEIISYFSRIGLWGMQEYVGKKENARHFETKKEATLYIRQMLDRPSKHKAVKI